MRASFRISMLAVATLALSALPAGADQACATNHVQATLGVFSEGSQSLPLYWAAEGDGQSTFTIRILDASCDGSTVSINYEVQDGTAANGTDYSFVDSGQVSFVNSVGHPREAKRNVSITNDVFGPPVPQELGLEVATVALTGMSGGRLIPPSSAPLVILDDDGTTPSMGMVTGAYTENETSAATNPGGGVPVFRSGDASGTTTADYSFGGGTATGGSDYLAPTSGKLTFAPGDRIEIIPVNLADDQATETDETFDVTITGPEVDAFAAKVTFTITDNEESFPPLSTLHHPRQNWKYKASDYRIREVHIFTEDVGGAGVVSSQFALRRNMKDKSCAWFTGKKFKKGKCDKEKWLKTGEYEPDFYYIKVPELTPSTGKIKDYTAYSRATDGAHNLESDLEVGRNDNTFEVKKGK